MMKAIAVAIAIMLAPVAIAMMLVWFVLRPDEQVRIDDGWED